MVSVKNHIIVYESAPNWLYKVPKLMKLQKVGMKNLALKNHVIGGAL